MQRAAVDHVERVLGFVGDVEAAAVGRGGNAVIDLDAADFAGDFVRGWIDEMNVVAGGIGLDDDRPSTVRKRQSAISRTNRQVSARRM